MAEVGQGQVMVVHVTVTHEAGYRLGDVVGDSVVEGEHDQGPVQVDAVVGGVDGELAQHPQTAQQVEGGLERWVVRVVHQCRGLALFGQGVVLTQSFVAQLHADQNETFTTQFTLSVFAVRF